MLITLGYSAERLEELEEWIVFIHSIPFKQD
jgi:hypothetical protein